MTIKNEDQINEVLRPLFLSEKSPLFEILDTHPGVDINLSNEIVLQWAYLGLENNASHPERTPIVKVLRTLVKDYGFDGELVYNITQKYVPEDLKSELEGILYG
jgi:plasmid stability protein